MRHLSAMVFAPLALSALASHATAQFQVTTNADSGPGSLRSAITSADAAATAATITFAINSGSNTIDLSSMLPILSNPNGISINGTNTGTLGGTITLDGGSSSNATGDRILFVGVTTGEANSTLVATTNSAYSFSNLTLRNGNAIGGNGGNGRNGGGGGAGLGGAMFVNAGTVNLQNIVFSGNRAVGGNGGIGNGNISFGNGGGGGMGGAGGNGGSGVSGGGGGFGVGANGGDGATGAAASGGTFVGANSGGFGSSPGNNMPGDPGGANGGGGGSGAGAGGGGVSGSGGAANQNGTSAGDGGFGGGGGGGLSFGGNGGSFFSGAPFGGGGGGGGGSGAGGDGGGGGGSNGGGGTLNGVGGGGNGGALNGGGGAGDGAAIFLRAGATLNLSCVSFSGDTVTGGAGANPGQGLGQALYMRDGSFCTYTVNSGVVTLAESASADLDQQIGGSFTKAGAGTLVLDGSSNFTGTVTVSGGTLQVLNISQWNSRTVDNAALILDQTADATYPHLISGTGSVTKVGAANLAITSDNLTGTNTYTGGTTISVGTLLGGPYSFGSGPIVDNGALVLEWNTTATYGTFANTTSGTGSVTKTLAGTVSVTGSNSYSGGTTVSAGTLLIANAQATGTGTVAVAAGAALDVETPAQIGGLAGAGVVYLNQYGVVTGSDNAPTTYSGSMTGTGVLAKVGSGAFTLSGSNNYVGGTIISGGSLVATNTTGSATGAGPVTVASGGTLSGGDGGGSASPFADSTQGFVAGTVTVQSGGALHPGANGAGLLSVAGGVSFQAGSIFAVDLATNNPRIGISPIDVNTNSRLVTPLDVLFDTTLTMSINGDGQTFTNGSTYDFFIGQDSGSAGSLPGSVIFEPTNFASAVNPTEFALSRSANGLDIILTFTPVPEPGSFVLCGVGLCGVAIRAWRRCRI